LKLLLVQTSKVELQSLFCPEGLFDNNCENEVNLIGDAAGFLNNLTYFAFKTLNLGNLKGLLKDFYACSI
jgi:hypothetical protein